MKNTRALTALVLFATATPAAHAADWEGLYLGGTATITPTEIHDAFEDDDSLQGGMLGGQLGYRFYMGPAVLGMEADYLFGEAAYRSEDRDVVIDQLGTVRANIGLPIGPLLPFATGGVAFGRASAGDGASPADLMDENTHFGVTVGTGVEASVTDSLSLRAEYQFMKFGEESYNLSGGTYDFEYDVHAIRAGVNFTF